MACGVVKPSKKEGTARRGEEGLPQRTFDDDSIQ